jgi:enoyl-CoA hydratase
MGGYQNLTIERDEKVIVITINRPKAMNALNWETVRELDAVFTELQNEQDIGAVILTGSGEKAFVAGADIGEMSDKGAMQAKEWSQLGHSLLAKMEQCCHPIIAACNGFTLGGGGELALACDIRIASMTAKFGFPELGLGIIPGFGGTQRLPRIIGKGRAKLMLYTGDLIDATEAYRIGLVELVTEPGELMTTAKKIAKKITTKAPLALRQAKLALNSGMEMTLPAACIFEIEASSMCFSTADQKEGMTAFVEKRKPNFSGN